jgi:predicted helicase
VVPGDDPRFTHLTQVWLWDDWPDSRKWSDKDIGTDLIAEDEDGNLWAIQCKAYADTYWVSKKDVNTFLSDTNRAVISHRMLIATTDRVGHNAEKTLHGQEKPATFFGLSDLQAAQVNWPASLSDLVAAPLPPKEPLDHQIEAVNAVIDGFAKFDRGQMLMACGTGKTLTALFVKEKLAANRTLVLAPSLSLLKQTIAEWTANKTLPFEYQVVCSDESVDDGGDAAVMKASDVSDRSPPIRRRSPTSCGARGSAWCSPPTSHHRRSPRRSRSARWRPSILWSPTRRTAPSVASPVPKSRCSPRSSTTRRSRRKSVCS